MLIQLFLKALPGLSLSLALAQCVYKLAEDFIVIVVVLVNFLTDDY